jgi:hypothetical protein
VESGGVGLEGVGLDWIHDVSQGDSQWWMVWKDVRNGAYSTSLAPPIDRWRRS